MRLALLAALAMATTAAPAFAQDAPSSPFSVSGTATLTSDYRFRGLSQSNRRVAGQGSLDVGHASGLYAGAYASSIHGYVANGADAELDLYGGYRHAVGGTTLDAGLLYYVFPGSDAASDYFEPYASASHTLGPFGAKVGGNFAWKQRGLGLPDATGARDRRAGAYGYGELSAALPGTGFSVKGHVGRSFVRDDRTFGARYTDWSLTAAYAWKALTFSAAYVDADRDIRSHPFGGGPDRDIAGAGVVGAVALSF